MLSFSFHDQANPGIDLPHEQKEKQGEIQKEDTACGKAQMLSQYGVWSISYIYHNIELASH